MPCSVPVGLTDELEACDLVSPTFQSPSRLNSLVVQGYKTFASKTEFVFAPTITAIVGPNGSGKSNITDAIRWVLGEQSFSLLRGKRTEDMIFTGSESRSRSGMASVTVTFDNSTGWLPIDFSEVTIGRRAYRDGQNEYLLNGKKVRLRDVTELLANCGLSQRTYTVVGQGLVDAALSLRAQERRQLFEEAAGIALYRERRKEALGRLDATQRNLDRVQDIQAELMPRLERLEVQAERARNYQRLRRDLKEGLRTWYGYHWHRLQETVRDARDRSNEFAQQREALREQQVAAERALVDTRDQITELRTELQRVSQELSGLYAERETSGRRLAVSQERLRWLQEQQGGDEAEIAEILKRRKVAEERLGEAQEEATRRETTLKGVEADLADFGGLDASEVSSRLERLQSQVQDLRGTLEEGVADLASCRTRLAQLAESKRELAAREEELQASFAEAQDKVLEQSRAAEAAESETVQSRQALDEAEAGVEKHRKHLVKSEGALQEHDRTVTELGSSLAAQEGMRELLSEAARGPAAGADALLHASEQGELKGLVGRLGDNLKIAAKYRKAIGAALGSFLGSVAFRKGADLGKAMEWLAANRSDGQAALLPVSGLRESSVVSPPKDVGCLGNAADLVRPEEEFKPLANLLLATTLIVEDRAAARRIVDHLPHYARVVTLAGEVFHATGAVEVGVGAIREKAERQLRELDTASPKIERKLALAEQKRDDHIVRVEEARGALRRAEETAKAAEESLLDASVRLEAAQLALQDSQRQSTALEEQLQVLGQEKVRAAEDLSQLQGEQSALEEDRARLEAALHKTEDDLTQTEETRQLLQVQERALLARVSAQDYREKVEELEQLCNSLEAEADTRQARLAASQAEQERLEEEIAEAQEKVEGVESRLQEASAKIAPSEERLANLEGDRSRLEAEENSLRRSLQATERSYSQVQIELARREEELASLRRQISDDFGLVRLDNGSLIARQEPLPLEGVVEELPVVKKLPQEAGIQVRRLRGQIRRMGAVNVEAEREADELGERVHFLKSQTEDLLRAESQIRKVIQELDARMRREFMTTFEAVAAGFGDAFRRLFGGGSAELVLTDPENLGETGIEIQTRLPGRRDHSLAMLSGGERSLTAAALIFALLKASPTPFCFLDEVDAMLDEVNVARYIEMLQEISEETQVIMITHNRQTVQCAEAVYGVSMGPDSSSQVISLRLDEVDERLAL